MEYIYFYLYEKSQKDYDHPKEDFAITNGKSFVVTDGVTIRYSNSQTPYPNPSPSAQVAKITAEKVFTDINQGKTLNDAIKDVHDEVKKYQSNSPYYKNRENNEYNFGSTQIAALTLKDNLMSYSYLADCEVQIFDKNINPKIEIYDEVEIANSYINKNLKKLQKNNESLGYIWRKKIRNHLNNVEENEIGYGSIDGIGDYTSFLHANTQRLNSGDLICICTDGFKQAIRQREFINKIKNSEFNDKLTQWCKQFFRENNLNSEKTAYFIKIH